ncbi:hypothetical protein HDU96_005700 [Phlyctochytrium bullatum]|nr:hypothetical protein HDU96_005700 [Phlyctochytrium bullatum]
MHPILTLLIFPALSLAQFEPYTAIENQYIVVYERSVSDASVQAHETWLEAATAGNLTALQDFQYQSFPKIAEYQQFTFLHHYDFGNFRGYAARLSDQIADVLRGLPDVKIVEQDRTVEAAALQANAPWGLRRISKPNLPLPSFYSYPDSAGSGADVYVLDTGIRLSHVDFGGRAVAGAAFSSDSDAADNHGHGTHVAGVIGGLLFGVAKKATLFSVKVLNSRATGTWADTVAGLSWVTRTARSRRTRKCVVSMAYTGAGSDAVDDAIGNAYDVGCAVIASAGNRNDDACNYSPARAYYALTVGASDQDDNFPSFSNYGNCVQLLAPGVNVLSTWRDGGTRVANGTSGSTAHVAGVAAITYASGNFDSPDELFDFVMTKAVPDVIKGNLRDSSNLLVQVPFAPAAEPSPSDGPGADDPINLPPITSPSPIGSPSPPLIPSPSNPPTSPLNLPTPSPNMSIPVDLTGLPTEITQISPSPISSPSWLSSPDSSPNSPTDSPSETPLPTPSTSDSPSPSNSPSISPSPSSPPSESPTPSPFPPDPSAPQDDCLHGPCQVGTRVSGRCGPCENAVIQLDVYCNLFSWDSLCVRIAKTICAEKCG